MPVHLRYQFQSLTSNYGRKFLVSSSHFNSQSLNFSKPTAMNTNSEPKSKRPTCPNCLKPISICFCSRIKSPNLDNQVNVAILQHNLETKHPLNSAKIAKLGLKNLILTTVFDVNFEARFDIRVLKSEFHAEDFECMSSVCGNASVNKEIAENGAPCFSIRIEKYGKMKSSKLEEIMNSSMSRELTSKGFVVKKFQWTKEAGTMEFEEFEITIPPGTAVLFPSSNSVAVEEVEFDVKNLIVLDGTWSKANRIYNENPWLKLLPCVRLDVDKLSLYSEVRVQPKPGYLSTLESIVYALEAFGEKKSILQGLDNLLEVFESMVADQRRCKDERLSRTSKSEDP